ncbi:unnamed protein product, partial [marine sediment metagenome]
DTYYFDGSDFVNFTQVIGSTSGTLAFWINITAGAGTQRNIIGRDDGGANQDFTLMIRGSAGNKAYWYLDDGAGVDKFILSNEAIPENVWVHVVGMWGTDGMKMYVNGVLQDDTSAVTYYPNRDFMIGADKTSFGFYEPWKGEIDEGGYWDRALTQEEITSLYNTGIGLTYPFAVDTCACPGAGNDWEIDMSDNCQINDDCDLTTGYLNFTGAGYANCNATITTTNLGDPGSEGILYIQDSCLIYVKG